MKLTDEQSKLRKFLKDNFHFPSLKKAGFFGPEISHQDYDKQAERICYYFGYKSVYEYARPEIDDYGCMSVASWPAKVGENGAFESGASAWITHTERTMKVNKKGKISESCKDW